MTFLVVFINVIPLQAYIHPFHIRLQHHGLKYVKSDRAIKSACRNGNFGMNPPIGPPIVPPTTENNFFDSLGQNSSSIGISTRKVVQNTLGFISLVVGIRNFILEPMYIPSSSMFPTFQIGDQLLVNKIEHLFRGDYRRNDVVVFKPTPLQQFLSPAMNGWFIKRIVAIPGDSVEIKDGELYVNDQKVSESFVQQKIKYNMEKTVVPINRYFVLGDNRNDSFDSHVWGFLPKENVLGRAVCKYWPLKRFGAIER